MMSFERKLLLNDVAILQDSGSADKELATLAADHGARSETLLKAVQCPAYARALALELSRQFLRIAGEISDASYQEPELVNVGS